MSDLLQEIKGYLDSIRHNAVNAALARNVKEYEVCIKTVFDCEEAVLSLFRKLDQEYWELRERFEQAQAKVERYEKALKKIADINLFEDIDRTTFLILTARKALKGGETQ
jgi:5-bromo-4-chloroindolyl phosphate hydrolysis protein